MVIQRSRSLLLNSGFLWNRLITRGHSWGYNKGVGPDQWHTLFPTCSDKNQSPIDIKTKDVVYDSKLQAFNLEELGKARDIKMILETNQGRSVQVNLVGENVKVTGGSLLGTYIVEQFHFHWGPEDNVGSEHTVDGKEFSSELHVVMHSEKYKNCGQALHQENGLAVLGFLVDVGNHNKNYDVITDRLKDIKSHEDTISLPNFQLMSLLPSTKYYYRYLGSQTTPPCASVIWTMFAERIYLSKNQLQEFRKLGKSHSPDMDLIYNCRKPQPLDGRTVISNNPTGGN